MNEKKLRICIIAIICVALGSLFQMNYQMLIEYVSKAFVFFGQWLREVSLKGGFHNMSAWMIIIALSALPLFYALIKKKKHLWDVFSIAISAEVFVFLYYLVNPTLLFTTNILVDVVPYTTMWIFGSLSVIVSTMLCWIFFYLFHHIKKTPENKLELIFIGFSFFYAFMTGCGFTYDLFHAFHTFTQGNTSLQLINQTSIVNILVTILFYLPHTFIIYLLYLVSQLITKLVNHPFDDEILAYSSKLSKVSTKMVIASLVTIFAANGIQFIAFRHIVYADYNFQFPILPLFLCAILILVNTYFMKVKELHDDNASII